MYTRWIEARGFKLKVIDRVEGEVAGVKSVDIEVHGRFAFGLLYGEKGSHRLVRQSPYNAKSLRQTSFAAVDVLPLIEQVRVAFCVPCFRAAFSGCTSTRGASRCAYEC
jgi:peptide chain release factor 2